MPTATLRRPRRRKKRPRLLRLAAPILALVLLAAAFWIALAKFSAQREDDPTRQARIVAIDAGHGGSDTGAIGVNGVRECDLTQATAQALWDLLEADPDITPVMCRSDWNEDLPAADRAKRVSASDATLSLSIHMNSDGGSGQARWRKFPDMTGNTVSYGCSLRKRRGRRKARWICSPDSEYKTRRRRFLRRRG